MNQRFLKKLLFFLCFISLFGTIEAKESPIPLIGVGGGYFDAGTNHSGGLLQVEYRSKMEFCQLRPQALLITPRFHSLFIGLGLGIDLYTTAHIVFSPSFTPGIYFKGRGKDLGYPLEFRSSLELAYEWNCKARLAGQFYHISNASLSNRNPGANALTLILLIPFGK